jgi:hypothetical protein
MSGFPDGDISVADAPPIAVVIPTVGRPTLAGLLQSLAASAGPPPAQLIIVDDRATPDGPLRTGAVPTRLASWLRIVHSGGRGPAAARNAGWRAAKAAWVAFLDDDVMVGPTWLADLATDIGKTGADTAGISGVVRVPLPPDRRPTDWERGTAGLAHAQWITADMAYRRDVLTELGGFDERFRRAYREDSDLALRVVAAGYQIAYGRRAVEHPVRPAPWHASIGQQRGNADDALMRRLHGPGWGRRAGSPPGRRLRHAVITGAAMTALGGLLLRRPVAATVAGALWTAGTAEFAWTRISPGPRTTDEIARMLATSVAIPPVAVGHWLAGVVRHRHEQPLTSLTSRTSPMSSFRQPGVVPSDSVAVSA